MNVKPNTDLIDKTKRLYKILEKETPNPTNGLTDDIFYFISKTTPLVNVDLLIKDENERTLLSWRDDRFTGSGWHVPGGIIRFKETIETRLRKVAETEIGALVEFDPKPLAINQIIENKKEIRSHFISILYKCFLSKNVKIENYGLRTNDPGYLKWHVNCPEDLLKYHKIYIDYI